MFIKKSKKEKTITKLINGFTLIEIVVVISIMAVLSVIIYSSFDASKAVSRDQERVSDISTIQLALEQYFNKYGVYPLTLRGLVPTYLLEIMKDPSNGIYYSDNYFPITKTQNTSNCISYQLWTKFERNNNYVLSKKGFNSGALPSNMYECVGDVIGESGHNTVNASTDPLVYDVMP